MFLSMKFCCACISAIKNLKTRKEGLTFYVNIIEFFNKHIVRKKVIDIF